MCWTDLVPYKVIALWFHIIFKETLLIRSNVRHLVVTEQHCEACIVCALSTLLLYLLPYVLPSDLCLTVCLPPRRLYPSCLDLGTFPTGAGSTGSADSKTDH